ncbi:MAG: hypothetical protein QGG42_04350 [Phycisphaerae bacterium]|jgi:hypothetical protein|nr:hypothetical protein [Phycisphaerae bacterium]
MNRYGIIGVSWVLTLLVIADATDENKKPFQMLEKHVEQAWGGWHGDARVLARLFNKERERLGDRFDECLIAFAGEVPDKHLVIPRFLVFPSYLKKQKPRPYLALLLLQQGIEISSRKTDEESQAHLLASSVLAAILSQQIGFQSLAQGHKKRAAMLLYSKPKLVGAWPCMDKDDRRVYDSIVIQRRRKQRTGDGDNGTSTKPKATTQRKQRDKLGSVGVSPALRERVDV